MEKQNIDINAALAKLDVALDTFANSDVYKAYLKSQAKFHRYSPTNVAWLWSQNPDISHVAGYNAWLAMGRKVRKGEKALRVLAPVPFKKIDADGNEKSGMWFKTAPVFDVSQTDIIEGHKNPFDPTKAPAWMPEGDTDAFDDLVRVVSANGPTVDVVDSLGRSGGCYYHATRHIEIPTTYSTVAMSTALIHEWAHDLMRDQKLSYDQEEVIVESITYVVAQAFGIIDETETSSLVYINGWMKDDKKSFKQALGLMQKTAHSMIEKIEHGLTS
jgi:antirestriction protein ArdC